MLSTSPSLCIPSNAEFLPLSINIWDCISGEETTPNNTSSLVIGFCNNHVVGYSTRFYKK